LQDADLTRKDYVDDADAAVVAQAVLLTGGQTVNGVKTFTSAPRSNLPPGIASDLTRADWVQQAIADAIAAIPPAAAVFAAALPISPS
jgi:hypothetical protein